MLNRIWRSLLTAGLFSGLLIPAALAEINLENGETQAQKTTVEQPATTVAEWMAQIEASQVQITGVRVESTEAGLSIVLETTDGRLAVPATTISGNSLTADIPNAVLSLPEGDAFQQVDPAVRINQVSVTSLPDDQVRVEIIGTDAPPVAEVTTAEAGLVFAVTPGALAGTEDAELEITVTAEEVEEDEGYNRSNATTATRTDTPLRDVPQSIQVVPKEVIEDQQAQNLQDVTRNVSGVFQGNTFGVSSDSFSIRGFDQDVFLRDGFRDPISRTRETANIEQVEVLKGPASVLYGTLEPGGIINVVTKKPLEDPLYSAELTVGSFGFVEPSIDLGGPLNESKTVLYRLNALYESGGVFRDFDQGVERFFVAPSLTWKISNSTDLTLHFEYLNDERPFDRGIVAIGDGIADIPFDRVLGELDDVTKSESFDTGYSLEHRFSDNWKLRNSFRFNSVDNSFVFTRSQEFNEETGLLDRAFSNNASVLKTYALQTNVVGEFTTGSVEHTLLFGIDLFRSTRDFDNRFSAELEDPLVRGGAPPQDIFNPEYGLVPRPGRDELPIRFLLDSRTDTLGIYLQDQIDLSKQWKLLVGGRFDIVNQKSDQSGDFGVSSSQQQNEAFSPRVGIVYQPIEPLSLYASFTQSFVPNTDIDAEGNLLEPERGTQYEAGLKGELFDGRLSATLAAYNITKSNIAIADPDLEGVSRPIGKERSRGIELDVRGEILPGWNIIGSYAYTDAEITEDDGSEIEGNRSFGVPEHAASLWTTYEIQRGDLQGLGFGTGLFFVGERQGDTANSFQVPNYARVDASIFYKRENWRFAVNFKNLFDTEYVESTGNSRVRINPGIPFTVLGTIRFEF